MFNKMVTPTSGGGGKVKQGTFTVTGTNVIDINDIGFKPIMIAIVFQGNGGTGTAAQVGATRIIYDERYSTTHTYRGIFAAANTYVIDSAEITTSTQKSNIIEVNANGFKYRNMGQGTTIQGTYYYTAIG